MEPPHLSFRPEVIIFVPGLTVSHQVFTIWFMCSKLCILITDWEQVLSAN